MMRSDLRNIPYNDEVSNDFVERRDRALSALVEMFKKGKRGERHFRFTLIPAARLKKIWVDFGKTGFVRDEKGMDAIAVRMLNNIAMLDLTNALSGHSQEDPDDILESGGYEDLPDKQEFLDSFLTDPETGGFYVSDYGLPYLHGAYSLIKRAETPEDQLFAVDKALNVVHQRSDLASWFVEGGTKTLQEISNDATTANPRQSVREFPYDYALYLKQNFPRIWAKGGNIRGNDTFRWWSAYRRGDRSPKVMHWWNVTRPAWIARHYRNTRLPGVIAQIKWGTVGTLGVAGMKRVVEDAIRELEL